MIPTSYKPLFQLTRGQTVESIHYGALAVVDAYGNLMAAYGDPYTVTFMRSSAKPFQALPFIERAGDQRFGLTAREIALMCASHSGTDEHVAAVEGIQKKVGVLESELLCGVHFPGHEPTANEMRARRQTPTPNQHNCSGKHTGMLAFTRLLNEIHPDLAYISPEHPIQKIILETFAQMCGLPVEDVAQGIDGCSAPNFALPLQHAALGFARLCDPQAGNVLPPARAAACQRIVAAMWNHPEMVGGPGRFDTALMRVGNGRFISKEGAEGYQAIGILPGVLGEGSPAVGVALKIADGDLRNRVHPAVAVEVLRQLGVLTADDLEQLARFGPGFEVLNIRKLHAGVGTPEFELERFPLTAAVGYGSA